MFIETAWLLPPSSVGAKCEMSLLGAWEINAIQTYKHSAPLALKICKIAEIIDSELRTLFT